jgi:hypothetical protein
LSNRLSYAITVVILLFAAILRLWDLSTLPPGLNQHEILDLRITETVREGRIAIFYDVGGEGRESGYGAGLAAVTTLTGAGLLTYRLFSVWIGLITLALVYALGTRLYGMLAGVGATALLAVNMAHTILTRSIAPEMLLPLFVTAVLLALAQSLPVYGARPYREPKATPFAALGVLLGVGFYIHPLSYVVVLMSMAFVAYMVLNRRAITRRTLSFTWFAVVVMIVLATPYLISSLQAPALSGANRVFSISPRVLTAFVSGLNGLFIQGDSRAIYNLPGRPLLDLVSGLFLVVGLIVALRSWRQSRFFLALLALLFLAPLALIADNSPNFPALAGLLPLLALLFGVGVSTLYHSLRGRGARLIGAGALVTLVLFNMQWTLRDLFMHWGALTNMREAYDSRIGEIAHYLDTSSADLPTVICTQSVHPNTSAMELASPLKLALMMQRSSRDLRYADCREALILSAAGTSERIIFLDADGYETFNPLLREWLDQGEIVARDDLPPRALITLDVTAALADRVGEFTTTAPIAFAPEVPGDPSVVAPPIRLGGNLTFLGYERSWADTYRPGDLVPILTYWRVDGTLPPDLRLFTHILADPAARPVAQNDPMSIRPDRMAARDVWLQVSYIQLPYSLRADTYSVSIGAYEDNTDTRLTVFEGERARGTRLFIGQLSVVR